MNIGYFLRQLRNSGFSRIANNFDMFHRLILQSDPLISLQRGLGKRKSRELTDNMKSLLSDSADKDSSDDDESREEETSSAGSTDSGSSDNLNDCD